MLVSLSIRDVVLIDRLDLSFQNGLGVLTGETGAGKSILLDALGLAIGGRAEAHLVRADAAQAAVSAEFDLAKDHPAMALLAEHGLGSEDGGLVLRRLLGKDGRSRAYINDQPVSVGLLRALGESLVEIQGQFAQQGLMNASTNRGLVDAFGRLDADAQAASRSWAEWREAETRFQQAERDLAAAREEESHLRHSYAELSELAPEPEEEARLADERNLLLHAEKLVEAMNAAVDNLASETTGAEARVATAQRGLERVAEQAGTRLDPVLSALDRAAAELTEAEAALASLSADLESDPQRLQDIDERYFALKDAARKYGCAVEELPSLTATLKERLDAIDTGGEGLEALLKAAQAARGRYLEAAESLSARRFDTARTLDRAVNAELPPLKLDKATFRTHVARLEESAWGPNGIDEVTFEVSTNPGAPAGPLRKVASGGELSRFLLALKVVLAEVSEIASLVFDEVDSGVGGATAAAVGERLSRLAEKRQVLVVTHSPQVAARATQHWQVRKGEDAGATLTHVAPLDAPARREEVARMLSGNEVTDEARAAADRLLGAA
jgi:DNA repair protein RecN (Recombination protein N)